MKSETSFEEIGGGIAVYTNHNHKFGTDAFLLSDFASPRGNETGCDLGCGCGIIPLLWLRQERAPQKLYAVDIQPDAIELVKQAVTHAQLGERLVPLNTDLRGLANSGQITKGSLDFVTCNPPYNAVATGLLSTSDSARTARHETGCTIDDVCGCAAKLLRFGGRLCLCQLPERLADVFESLRRHKLEPKRLRFVQKNAESAPWLFLVEAKLGAKPFLKVEAPLTLYENPGETSPELKKIYAMYGSVQ